MVRLSEARCLPQVAQLYKQGTDSSCSDLNFTRGADRCDRVPVNGLLCINNYLKEPYRNNSALTVQVCCLLCSEMPAFCLCSQSSFQECP